MKKYESLFKGKSLKESEASRNRIFKSGRYTDLWNKYVPSSGPTGYVEAELLRAINSLMYDYYNNGWGVNNKTGPLNYLKSKRYLNNEISIYDLAEGSKSKKIENYMVRALIKIVQNLNKADVKGILTPTNDDMYDDEISEREWDKLTQEDEDYYDDEEDDEW